MLKNCKLPLLTHETKFQNNKKCATGKFYYCTNAIYLVAIKATLEPLVPSVIHKPDVAIILNGFPVLQCEINSSPMEDTVAKLFGNLVDVLRYIRHFDCNIATWSGFAFPKFVTDSTNNYACIVQVS